MFRVRGQVPRALVICIACSFSFIAVGVADIVNEDFEQGLPAGWEIEGDLSNGQHVWQVGALDPAFTSTGGPPASHSGESCVGTILVDNHPNSTTSRLITAPCDLPQVSADEEVWLRFWQWFSYYDSGDNGYVEISVYDEELGWREWESIDGPQADTSNTLVARYYSFAWTHCGVDLTRFAGKRVRLGFLHTSNGSSAWAGWYIDDVEITVERVLSASELATSFEDGGQRWTADRGHWQIGAVDPEPTDVRTDGPSSCRSGQFCAGTILSGRHNNNGRSYLVSPSFIVPQATQDREVWLRFWQWFSYYDTGDKGHLEVSVYDEQLGWQEWESVKDDGGLPLVPAVGSSEGLWVEQEVDLSAYAGERVRLGFLHISNGSNAWAGWYIDDIVIGVVDPTQPQFLRGDVQVDGQRNIADPVTILNHLFLGTPPTLDCRKAADTDDTGGINIADAVFLLRHLFVGTVPELPPPFLVCGADPTLDNLTCDSFAACP